MALAITAALDRIDAILSATNGSTTMREVYRGEMRGIPSTGPYACYFLTGRRAPPVGRMTLPNTMARWIVRVECAWVMSQEANHMSAVEIEIWNAVRDLFAAFRGDSTLNAAEDAGVTDLDIGDPTVEFREFARGPEGNGYRVLMFDLELESLEEETISA